MTVLRRSECGDPLAAEASQTLLTPEPQPSAMDRPVKRPRLDLSSQTKDAPRCRDRIEHNDNSEMSDATQRRDWDEEGHLVEHSDVSSAVCGLTQRRGLEEVGHPLEHSDVSSEVSDATHCRNWDEEGHLMEHSDVSSEVRNVIQRGDWRKVEHLMERSQYSEEQRSHVMPNCKLSQWDQFMTHLVATGQWQFVTNLLDIVSDENATWRVGDTRVDSRVLGLVARGLWLSVSDVLRSGVSDSLRRWVIGVACQRADGCEFIQYILPYCAGDQRDVVLEKLVTRGLWMSVDTLLGRGVSPTQHRWALHEACQKAGDAEFELFIAPHCADDQLGDVLITLVTRRLWKSVSRVLDRVVSPTQHSWAVQEACLHAGDEVVSTCILPHCADDQLGDVLNTLVTRRLWKSVNGVLYQGVSPTEHSRAVQEYCQHAEDEAAMQWVLPHCCGDVLDIVLEKLLTRGWWMSVDILLGRGVRPTQHRWATHEACQKAGDAPQCADDQLGDVLTILVTRGLWMSVSRVLDRGVSPTQHSWAVHEACLHAGDEVVLEWILPHCADDQLGDVLTTLVTRRLWKSASRVLDWGVSPFKRWWAVQEACQHSDDEDALQHIVDEHVYDEDEDILTILASRGLWKYAARVLWMDVNATKTIHDGISVLHSLIRREHWYLVELLMGYVEEFHQHAFCAAEGDGDRRTPLGILIDSRQTQIIRHISSRCLDLSKGVNSAGETTLHVACLTGPPGMLQELVGKRVDPRAVTVSGHSALSYAVICRDIPQQTVAECIRLGFTTHQSHLANSGETPGANMAQDTMGSEDTIGSEVPGVYMAQDTMGSEAAGANMAQDTMDNEAPGANMAQDTIGSEDTMGSEAPGANMAQDTMGSQAPGANVAQDTMGSEDTMGSQAPGANMAQDTMDNEAPGANMAQDTMGSQAPGANMAQDTMGSQAPGANMAQDTMGSQAPGANMAQDTMGSEDTMGSQAPGASMAQDTMGSQAPGANMAQDTMGNEVPGANMAQDTMEGEAPGDDMAQDTMEGEAPGANMAQDIMGSQAPGANMAQDTMGSQAPGDDIAQDTMEGEAPGDDMAQDTMGSQAPGDDIAQDTMEGEAPGDDMAQDTMEGEAPGDDMAQVTMEGEAPGDDIAQVTMEGEAPGDDMAQVTMEGEAPGDDIAQITMEGEAPGDDMAQVSRDSEENHMEMSHLSDSETQRLEENNGDNADARSNENDTNGMDENNSDHDDIQSFNGGSAHSSENDTNSMSTNISDNDDMDSFVSGFEDSHSNDSDDNHSMTSDARDSMMSSPTLLAVMRGLPLVTQMLYESGACSYRELFRLQPCLRDLLHADPAKTVELEAEFYNTMSRVYENDPDGEPDYMDVDTERVQVCARYLQEVSLHPHSLKSTCRRVISRCLKLHDKREEDVGQLPLEPAMRRYVMFSDLTHPDFGLQDDTAHIQTRDDFVRHHLSKHLSSTTEGSGCDVVTDKETHLLADGRQEVDESHTDDDRQ